MDHIGEWDTVIESVCSKVEAKQGEVVRGLWYAVRGFPLPRVESYSDDVRTIRFSYSTADHFLECEIYETGLCDWFYCSHNRVYGVGGVEGTSGEGVEVPIEHLVRMLELHFNWEPVV